MAARPSGGTLLVSGTKDPVEGAAEEPTWSLPESSGSVLVAPDSGITVKWLGLLIKLARVLAGFTKQPYSLMPW